MNKESSFNKDKFNMRCECAWCGKYLYSLESTVNEGGVSHGICGDCMEINFSKYAKK